MHAWDHYIENSIIEKIDFFVSMIEYPKNLSLTSLVSIVLIYLSFFLHFWVDYQMCAAGLFASVLNYK